MDEETEVSDFLQKRREFELTETMMLQDEEIARLRTNLSDLNYSIIKKQKSAGKLNKLRSKKQSLLDEIKSILSNTQTEISNLTKSHLVEMNDTKLSYSQNSTLLTDEYVEKEAKLQDNIDLTNLNEAEKLEKMRAAVAHVLKEQEQLVEEHKAIEMSKYTELALQLRDKALELQEKIIKAKDKLNSTKIKVKKQLNSTFQDLTSRESLLETTIISYNNSINDTENEHKREIKILKKQHNDEIESLKQKIEEQTHIIESIRVKMSESIATLTEVSSTYSALKDEKTELETESSSILLNVSKPLENEIEKNSDASDKIKRLNQTSSKLKKENEALMKEIKRLDFLIYGRNGKYYTGDPEPLHKKPFIPYGIYAK